MTSKKNLLLKIRKDIEYIYDTGKLGDLTRSEASEVLDIYGNYLIMNKTAETIQKAVANWYKKYHFIAVSEVGIGWRIALINI